MKKIIWMLILFFSANSFAQENVIALEKAPIHIHDRAAIERGAKFFAANCMACHTLIYMRYNKLARDAGVLYERMPVQVKSWPLGVAPPDLSLEAQYRGVDWIYTYLHSFYTDTARPFGVNNLLMPNTAMSGILVPYQGQQILQKSDDSNQKILTHDVQWYDLVELQAKGSMTPEQFDATVADVVNFLQYASAPYQVEQENLGYWVLGFLIILFILMYLLKHAYWKQLEKRQREL